MQIRFHHRRFARVSVLGLTAVGAALGLGSMLSAESEIPSPGRDADELVRQLGAADYRQREQAEDDLQRLGVDAIPSLKEAANDSDLELRYRARRLMRIIEQQQQHELLNQFLSSYDPELAQQIAGWQRFSEFVGDDVEARELFVEMYEAEPELMALLERSAQSLPFVLEKRTLELRPQSGQRPQMLGVPAATTAVLLLASLDPAAPASPTTRTLINSLVNESEFRRAATDSPDPPVRRLLAVWVSQASDVPAATRMTVGAKFQLEAAVDPALELINSRVHGSQLQYAVFTLARIGNSDHISALQRLLDDTTVISERQRGDDASFTCQVRDVALAALIHLIGKHPKEFGFTELQSNANSLYSLNTAGFASDEERAAAFRQWELWRRVQRRNGRAIDENAVEGVSL